MSPTLKSIADETLQLTPAQRAELAGFLVESLDASQPDEVQRRWFREAKQRLSEVRDGAVVTIPGEDVLAEARRLVNR